MRKNMKKQGKFLTITGCIFALGILLSIIGIALGGNLAEASITQDKFTTKTFRKTIDNPAEIHSLSFDVSASDITLQEGSDFSIEGTGISKCKIKDGTWKVTSKIKNSFFWGLFPIKVGNWNIFGTKKGRKITITIPRDHALKEVSLDAKAIDWRIDRLNCQDLDIDVAAGTIRIDHLTSNKTDISVSAGDVRIKSFQIGGEAEISCRIGDIRLGSEDTRENNLCNKLEAECSMGDVRYYGKLTGDNEVDVTMGSIKLNLTGSANQYDFSSNATLGDVRHKNRDASPNSASPLYGTGNLSCTMGDISVTYSE